MTALQTFHALLSRVRGIVDTFTRSDNPTSLGTADTGQPWTAVGTPSWGVNAGTAMQSMATDAESWVDAGFADMAVTVTFTTGVNYQTVVARYTPPWSTGTGYRLAYSGGVTSSLARRVPGASQVLYSLTLSAGETYTIWTKREAGGVRVKLFKESSLIFELLDTTPIPDGTKVAFVNPSTGSAGGRFDGLRVVPT